MGMDGPSREVAALYERACGPLIGLLASIGGSRSDAEEVAQDAFVKALRHWDRVRTYDDPAGWVRLVAVRMLVSRHRRRQVAVRGLRRLAGRADQHGPGPTADGVDVERALRALPVAHRAVLILHHALDLPVETVAEQLGVPVGTVKSRLSRARTALAPLLRDDDEEELNDHA